MCLIVHRDPGDKGRGSNLPNAVIDTNEHANNDGFGIAWRTREGALVHDKFGPADFAKFHTLLKRIDKDTSTEYVAHFRTATHGAACQALSHPFTYIDPVEGEVAVFHNGMLDVAVTKTESDTQVFVDTLLAQLPSRWWANEALLSLVEMAADTSRLVVMTARETVRINAYLGETKGGIWYSTSPFPAWSRGVVGQYGGTFGYSYRKNADGTWSPNAAPKAVTSVTVPTVWRKPEADTVDVRDWDDPDKIQGYAHGVTDWYHGGHRVTPLGDVKQGDHNGAVVCPTCKMDGEYYKIDGSIYIDMAHIVRVEDDESEGAA